MDATEKRLAREVERTRRAMEKRSETRFAMPPGSTRARVTTANAKWHIACEAHTRAVNALESYCAAKAVA